MDAVARLTPDFTETTVVVTGGAAGIGHECAVYFAAAGANVVLADRSATVEDTAQELPGPGRHRGLRVDVTSSEEVCALIEMLRTDYHGRVEVLVNCAGLALLNPALELTDEDWDTTVAVNLSGSFRMARALGGLMVDAGYGRVITIASQAAVVALDRHVAYAASKAGVVGMTRVLASEWAAHGVTVNAISPTVVDTELGRKAWEGEPGRVMRDSIPMGRFARTDEVAALVGYLASAHTAMITGQNIVIDGGYTMV